MLCREAEADLISKSFALIQTASCFSLRKRTLLPTGCAGGLKALTVPFFVKAINKLCNKASQVFGLTVSHPPGELFPRPGQLGRDGKALCWKCLQQKPGHRLPGGAQAPEAIRSFHFSSLPDQTLACWSHAANASGFTERCVGN